MPGLAVPGRLAFRDALPTMQEFWRLARAGELPPATQRPVASPRGADAYDTLNPGHGNPAHLLENANEPL